MWNPFQQLSVATRLKLLSVLSVSTVLGVALALLWTMHEQQMADRRQAVRQTVEVAHSLISHYGKLAEKGVIDEATAKRQAIAALDAMRYDQREYFWVNDMDVRMVHHPIKPQLDGTSVAEVKDPKGVALFQRFVSTVREQGQGFVAYQWPKPGEKDPVDKVSFVKGYAPWGWVVGSGLYVDDIAKAFAAHAFQVMLGVLASALVMGWLTLRTTRRLSAGVKQAVDMAEAIAQGDIRERRIEPHWQTGHDEISRLLKAMQRMGASLHQTVSSVQQTVDSVALASQQIAAGNQDLSHRTEQAASSLQHTASSMDELSASVRSNSGSSQAAQQMAGEAFEPGFCRGGGRSAPAGTTQRPSRQGNQKPDQRLDRTSRRRQRHGARGGRHHGPHRSLGGPSDPPDRRHRRLDPIAKRWREPHPCCRGQPGPDDAAERGAGGRIKRRGGQLARSGARFGHGRSAIQGGRLIKPPPLRSFHQRNTAAKASATRSTLLAFKPAAHMRPERNTYTPCSSRNASAWARLTPV
jgi:methyl-accepting chemotaxis protein